MCESCSSGISVVSATEMVIMATVLARKPRGPRVQYGYSATTKALWAMPTLPQQKRERHP